MAEPGADLAGADSVARADGRPELDDTIGSAEAADILGVTAREVRRKASEGVLPGRRVRTRRGREWRFRPEDVQAHLRGAEGAAAGHAVARTEADAEAVLVRIDANTDALVGLTQGLEDLGGLPAALAGVQEAISSQAEAARELAAAVLEENRRLAAQVGELEAELAERRDRPWWRRLLGLDRGTEVRS